MKRFVFARAALFVGVSSGLSGMGLALLLHKIQQISFGFSGSLLQKHASFLDVVMAASVPRRILVLVVCGLVAGFGWLLLYRKGTPLVSIAHAVHATRPAMPFGSTMVHALLQIVIVAMGAPLGREVAPREVGAAIAIWLSNKMGVSLRDVRILTACGAGAGLAAVYNVPLGGVLFILELLLREWRWRVVWPALLTCSIATVISWTGLGNTCQYHVPDLAVNASFVMWALCMGPVFGFAGRAFANLMMQARQVAPKDWRLPVYCLLNFSMIGLLSAYFPALLGNGAGPVQIGFDNAMGARLALVLVSLKVLTTWSSLRAGASGGLLTPSIACGALLAIVLGQCWSFFWPGISSGAFAVVGATAFLAASQKMPLTAVVLLFEMTGINYHFLIPMLFAVVGSIYSSDILD